MLSSQFQAVRCLAYWLSPTIQSSTHFQRWLALAQAAFTTIRQLSAAGKGLSSWCNRKLVFGAILPILTYGCDVFTPEVTALKKLDSFWEECSGGQQIVFTPPPLALYTEKPDYHLSSPSVYTVAGQPPSTWSALLQNLILPPPGYLSLCPPGTTDDHRFLLRGCSKAVHLTSWLRPTVNSTKHIPLDSICHETSDLIAEIPILPRAFTSLPRFICGRIHQMRTGVSHLAAHM